MKRIAFHIALLTLPALPPAMADFSGYIKSYAVVQDEIDTPVIQADRLWQSRNSMRLMWRRLGDDYAWALHYELAPAFNSRSRNFDNATFTTGSNVYRVSDPQPTLDDGEDKHRLYQNLDRFNVQFNLEAGDLTIGRQAIAFGAARVINPTDVFIPFDVRTFDQEYRVGVDAVRFQYPFGRLGEIDMGIVLGDGGRSDNSAGFFQIRDNLGGFDLQFSLIRFAEQNLAGAGLQSSLWNLGTWLETAYVSGDFDYWRTSAGLDYAFTENVYGMIEYHHNGAGSDDPALYLQQSTTLPYQRGGVFLLGEHYLIPVITWQATPLWSLAFQSLHNLDDGSAFMSVTAQYNLAENVYADFGYYHFRGDDLSLVAGMPLLESEYGTNPDTLYASLRYYF